jgi:subtilisin family serine protease
MRRMFYVLALLLLMGFSGPRAQAQDYVRGEVIVQVLPGVDINLLSRLYGLRILGKSAFEPVYRLGLPLLSVLNLDTVLQILRLDPLIVAADPNLLTGFPDGTIGSPWSSVFVDRAAPQRYEEQSSYSQVNYSSSDYGSETGCSAFTPMVPIAPKAQRVADGSGVTVAVLDTGISPRHRFLARRLVPGWDFVSNERNADDMPDYRDNNDNDLVDEGVGHGTFAAGLIHRLAPRASLMPIRVLDSDGSGTLWNAAEGIRYAAANGANVLNLSLGCSRNSAIMNRAIRYATARGAVVVVAAGNRGSSTTYSPAGHTEALTVAALNPDNTKAPFSNYGDAIDVAAPGVSIASTYWDGRFATWSGTSFAAPLVAAEAVLIRSVAPGLSASGVRSLIIETSTSVNPWNPAYHDQLGKNGAGLINIRAALNRL